MASTSGRNCYNRNGTIITDVAYQPCSSDTSHDSACCGTNHQGAGHTLVADDVCEANGLCQNFEAFDGTNEGEKLWWRQGCTDPTWQSEYCLRSVCNSVQWQGENAPVRKCGDNSWCCGDKSCCSTSASIFTLAATVGPTSTSIAASSTSSSLASESNSIGSLAPSPTSPPASTLALDTNIIAATPSVNSPIGTSPPATPDASSSGLSIGAKAGIGSGVAVGVILVLIIIVLALKLRNKTKAQEKDATDTARFLDQEKSQTIIYAHEVPPVELHGESARVEMGGVGAAELPSNRGDAELPACEAVGAEKPAK